MVFNERQTERERETEGPRTGMFFLVKEEEMDGMLQRRVKKNGEQ